MTNKPPIPSPFPEPELEAETLSFKPSVLPVFFGICTTSAPGLVILFVPLITAKRISFAPFIVVLVIEVAFAFIMAHIYRVTVSPEDIHGHSFWGKPTRLQWQEIVSAKKVNTLGLKYLKLSSKSQRNVIWLPLYLCDLSEFAQAVAKLAGEDNPLTQQLTHYRFSNKAR